MKRSKPTLIRAIIFILIALMLTAPISGCGISLFGDSLPSGIFQYDPENLPTAQPPTATSEAQPNTPESQQPTLTSEQLLGTMQYDPTADPLKEEQLLATEVLTPTATLLPDQLTSTPPQPTPTATTAGSIPPEPVCGSQPVMHILMLGIDENEQADAIRLLRLDFVTEKVSVLSIPRDFYVDISDMWMHGIRKGRINATYGYGEYFNGNGGGIISMATNLNYNYGVSFDRYLVIHLKEIAKYIDIVGGVDIVLDKTVTDGYVTFNQGLHHFNGETAVYFMRMRLADSDFYRISRQSDLVTALFEKVMREKNILQIIRLGFTLLADNAIHTDFAIKDIYTLACLASRLKSENLAFFGIPWSMFHGAITTSGANVQIPHPEVPAFIQSVMDGTYKP